MYLYTTKYSDKAIQYSTSDTAINKLNIAKFIVYERYLRAI